MQYTSSRRFDKEFAKLPKKTKVQCIERIKVFLENPFNPLLNNHSVHYPYEGCRSINITGDIRAIYEVVNEETVLFIRVGSHSELYK